MRVAFNAPVWTLLFACILSLAAAPACAAVYKCTDDHGQTLYTSAPCSKDAREVPDNTGVMPAAETGKGGVSSLLQRLGAGDGGGMMTILLLALPSLAGILFFLFRRKPQTLR